jgi:hypothetical protein
MGRVANIAPWPLYPQERQGTHCTRRWVGPGANLDGCGKSRPHRDSIPVGVCTAGGGEGRGNYK